MTREHRDPLPLALFFLSTLNVTAEPSALTSPSFLSEAFLWERCVATFTFGARKPNHSPPPLHETPLLGGNQRELARQKNMKKQSDSVKGKRRDDGLSAAARKQRDSEIMQQKQKKANEKKEEPK
ncbi:small EDRK-rich factor 2 isoform X4 [Carlito syrichta]|uniref:Small EDRK-rich factor 2 n=1 Tax=Carlito syrichta TaxID=1868482 RepID=A0A3Q0E013_CARSF|nr:small EDRK-rich factor 2 isoform X4 [Carlito syrichta]